MPIVIASILRVVLPWSLVFRTPIQFNTVDAYYMMRYADVWYSLPKYDFMMYPKGNDISGVVLGWSGMIAIVSNWFNIPIDIVGAVLPVLFGILTLIPIYIITRVLFGKIPALITTIVASVLPGEFLSRTQLGAADYHAAEIFMFTMAMMFAILSIKTNRWYIAGVIAFVIGYYLIWPGALLILFIFGVFVLVKLVQWIFAMKLTVFRTSVYIGAFAGIGLLFFMSAIGQELLRQFVFMFSWNFSNAISEGQALLFSNGVFDISTVFAYFGIAFYILLIGLGIIIYQVRKEKDNALLLFLIWSGVILLLTLAHRRYAYYLAANVAIITGYCCWLFLKYSKYRNIVIVVLLMLLLLVPLVRTSVSLTQSKDGYMPDSWIDATNWLRGQSIDEAYYSGAYTSNAVLCWWNYGYWIIRAGHTPAYFTPGSPYHEDVMYIYSSNYQDTVVNAMANLKYLIITNESLHGQAVTEIYLADGDTEQLRLVWQSSQIAEINGKWYPEIKIYERR
jgi:asparagine N-glycosylation enzyme membrane subunit Stt3